MFRENRVNMLITDWFMSEVNGPELTRMVRRLRSDYYVYIIMITASSIQGSR